MTSGLQQYEEYWKLTLEYTDIDGVRFIETLRQTVAHIDTYGPEAGRSRQYKELQEKLNVLFPKQDMGSVRKAINQFLKLGFVETGLASYHQETKAFLEARTSRRRRSLFSKIVYTASSFNRSVTEQSEQREINFLIKTLEEVGRLDKKDIVSLMTLADLSAYPSGCLKENELAQVRKAAEESGFITRKYNQLSYLWGVLRKLDGLRIQGDAVYFEEDAKDIFGEKESEARKRDSYLHGIYKNELKQEVLEEAGKVACMVEGTEHLTLIASHIKPFIQSSEQEAYDPMNGLLLTQNMDGLFDKGHISFNDDGSIIISPMLPEGLKNLLITMRIAAPFLKPARLSFLQFHRDHFKNRLYTSL